MERWKAKYKKIVLAFLLSLISTIVVQNCVFAEKAEEPQKEKYTEEYIKWLNLPEEEQKNTIMPRPIEIKNNKLKEANISTIRPFALASSFDLRNRINMTVKDQGQTNVCWAFTALGSLESNLQLRKNITLDLSERHVDYATSQSFTTANAKGFNRQCNTGGFSSMAYAYFTNGSGAILERDMPFSNTFGNQNISYIQGKQIQTKVEDFIDFPEFTPSSDITTAERNEIIKKVKEHIMANGGLYISVNGDALQDNSEHFSRAYHASYYDGSDGTNHAVLLVGWDDNFPKEKFNASHRPLQNGAWIIRNSWGTSWGENGYGYISYEDKCVGIEVTGIERATNTIDYDNLYQHDELGYSGSRTYNTEKIYAANVFKKNTTQIETLKEVSVTLLQDAYCKVYVNPKNADKSSNNLVLATKDAVLCQAGYHTIKFDKPLALTGSEFVVVVEYYVPGGKANAALEYKYGPYYTTVSSNQGESFIASKLTSNSGWYDVSASGGENATIKAFSNNTPTLNVLSVGSVTTSATPIYDEVGGTITVPVTTSGIADSSQLDIVIKKAGVNVTNQFTITGNTVNNNKAQLSVKAPARIEKGTYQVEVSYGNLAKKTASFTIEEYIHVTSISLNTTSIKMKKSDTAQLKVTVNPQNAVNKSIDIINSNQNVAKIDGNGIITALSRGTTKFTLKSVDGNKTAECTVNVIDPQITYGALEYTSEATGNQRGQALIGATSIDIDNNTNINVRIKFKQQDVTSKFTITGNQINSNRANIKIVIPMTIEEGSYTVELSDAITGKTVNKTFEVKAIELSINSVTQSVKPMYNEIGGEVTLKVQTIGIANGEQIGIKVLKGNQDVSSKFTITGNTINNNQATVKLKVGTIEEGTYAVQASFSGVTSENKTFNIEKYIHVEKIELDKDSIKIRKGDETQIAITLTPNNAINKKVNLLNTDPSVASIDENCKIIARKRGTTTITALADDGNKTAECKVTVIDPSITIDGVQYDEKVRGGKRGNIQLHVSSIDIEDNTNLEVSIQKKDTAIRSTTVVTDKFTITGNTLINNEANIIVNIPDNIEIGKYAIQAKFEEGITCQSEIEIKEVEVEMGNIVSSSEKIYERIGGTITIPITSTNIANAESFHVKITKDTEDVTSKFIITGNRLENGMANIKVGAPSDIIAGVYKVEISYANFAKQETTFTVEEYISVQSIQVDKTQVNLKEGEEEKVEITIHPENALNKNIKVESSNPQVATMTADGIITAKAKGETIITIKSEEGEQTASIKVTVTEKENNNNQNGNGSNHQGNLNNNNGNKNTGGPNSQVNATIANKQIPNTGKTVSVTIIIISSLSFVASFILYKRYKNI